MSFFLTALNYPNIFFSMLAFVAGSFLLGLITYKRDWLDEKYGLHSKYHIGMNYTVIFYFLCVITVTCSVLFFPPILKSYGLNYALIVFISQYIPVVFMLLRLDVYSEENCPVKKRDDFGNEYVENTLGYNPLIYYFITFPYFTVTAIGIDAYVSDILRHSYLTDSLAYLIITFAILFLLLSPDLLDKVLPFDLRTLKGTGKLIVLLVIILSVVRFFLV